jgi:L-xylulokinase
MSSSKGSDATRSSKMFLGIDVGQTVVKAALFNEEGKKIAISDTKTKTLNPKLGYYERDMDDLWNRTREIIRDITKKVDPKDIKAIGLSGHGSGCYPLDEMGKPVGNGILASDQRAKEIIKGWKKDGTLGIFLGKTGITYSPAIMPVLLLWYKENDKKKYNKIKHLLFCKDFIRFKLTNKVATDISDPYGVLNVKTQNYDEEIFELAGVSELVSALPQLKDKSYDLAGYITEEAARGTGLKEGTPVAVGAHDACCNTLAVGAIKDNIVCTGGGTWSINLLVTDKPYVSQRWYCENFIEKGKWMLEGASPTSAINLEWFIENFCEKEKERAKKEGKTVYQICDEEIKGVDTNILYHSFLLGLPFHIPFQRNAMASFIGINKADGKKEILRALYEGVAFAHRAHIEEYEKAMGIGEIRFTGGAAKSAVWAQMLADVLGRKVTIVDKVETGCFGAALLGTLSIGEIRSLKEAVALIGIKEKYYPKKDYNKKYEIYKRSCSSLGEIWNDLEDLRSGGEKCIS